MHRRSEPLASAYQHHRSIGAQGVELQACNSKRFSALAGISALYGKALRGGITSMSPQSPAPRSVLCH